MVLSANGGDPRVREVRSPECPNDAPAQIAQGVAGVCGLCAWGFYTPASPAHQRGEPAAGLEMQPVVRDGAPLGYKSQCGRVSVVRHPDGRVGAVRAIDGEPRFFPAIAGNWAAERYLRTHGLGLAAQEHAA